MTPVEAYLAAQARLYGQSAEDIRRSLVEHGDGLQGQLHELHKRPCADRADTAARNLEAVAKLIRRYGEMLVRRETPTV